MICCCLNVSYVGSLFNSIVFLIFLYLFSILIITILYGNSIDFKIKSLKYSWTSMNKKGQMKIDVYFTKIIYLITSRHHPEHEFIVRLSWGWIKWSNQANICCCIFVDFRKILLFISDFEYTIVFVRSSR